MVDGGADCLNCRYEAPGTDAATRFIENVLRISAYEAVTQGGEFPLGVCP